MVSNVYMDRDYNSITKSIVETGFFSEYLPPCFKLEPEVFSKFPPENCDLIPPYCFTMSRYNGNDARRNIYIPEISAYVVLCNYLINNDIIKELIEFTETDESSFSPILGKNSSIMRHEQSYIDNKEDISSDYIENIVKKIIRSAGAKKILKLDISNCFSSFYMHMIPAIFLGLDKAEEEYKKILNKSNPQAKNEFYEKYQKLDKLLRQQNLNRTNGLLSGPIISKIIVEGILARIDKELSSESIKFSRYVDDYEVYLYDDNYKTIISIFTRILKRYGFVLNNEKTEVISFPYYVAENLEKIFKKYKKEEMDNSDLMEMFNVYFLLEKNGVKGAIRYLIKTLEKDPITAPDFHLYKAYLLSILENDERSLSKVCSLFIENRRNLTLDDRDVKNIERMIEKHIDYEHDLEVIWLLFLLIETSSIRQDNGIILKIINSKNELAHIVLLRNDLLNKDKIDLLKKSASSWILLYELYASQHLEEEELKSKLNIKKNIKMYQYLKQNNIHFCN